MQYMSLIDDTLLINSKDKHAAHGEIAPAQAQGAIYTYGSRYGTNPVPKYRISSKVSLVIRFFYLCD